MKILKLEKNTYFILEDTGKNMKENRWIINSKSRLTNR